jgi:hypothetical protein
VKVGIGLPSAVSPPDGRVVVEGAAAAEPAGFASVAGTATTLDGVRAELDAHRQAGCDEVLLFPCAADLSQLELAAEAL